MAETFSVEAIGKVCGGRAEPTDDDWGKERCVIELDARFLPDALIGLADFSHVEVLYLFHRVDEDKVEEGARRAGELVVQ